jgi:hypothetical protein
MEEEREGVCVCVCELHARKWEEGKETAVDGELGVFCVRFC